MEKIIYWFYGAVKTNTSLRSVLDYAPLRSAPWSYFLIIKVEK